MNGILLIAATLLAGGPPQDVTVVKAKMVITVSGKEIKDGMILIRDGKIAEVGASIEIPEGATVIDATSEVVMPGLVNPYSRTGLLGGGGAVDAKASEVIDPLNEEFLRQARAGYTTLALYPSSGLMSGRIAVVKTRPGPVDSMVVAEDGVLRFSFTASTANKDNLRKALTAAKTFIEAEKKAAEEKKKKKEPGKKPPAKTGTEKAKTPQETGGKPPAGKPPKKPKKPTAKDKIMMEFLNGKRRAMVEVNNPAGLLHLWQVFDEFKEFKFKVTYVLNANLHQVVERLGRRKAEVILMPTVTFLPYTADRICPARELQRQKCTFAFRPASGFANVRFDAARMVKYGVTREAVLKALTLTPATFAGVADRVGSIEVGKDADLLFLTDDPLSVNAKVRRVMIEGHVVHEESK